MDIIDLVVYLTQAMRDPVFAVLYGFFNVILSLPGMDLGGLLRGMIVIFAS
jgi:hypothetical protein